MKKISAISIAFTYIGTIVGAGFASGQEIKKYFADFGVWGIVGLLLAAVLISVLGKKIMIVCNKNNIETYNKLLKFTSNNTLAKCFDFLITIFLIGTITTMSSGMGTILMQVFNIPLWIGSLFLILLSVFIVKKGINEISKLNVLIVPILIIVTIVVSITSLDGFDQISFKTNISIYRSIFSAILYVAYNIVMAISILPALALSSNEKEIKKGAMWSGIIIGILGLLILLALLTNYDIIQNVEIPLAILSNRYIGIYIITFILEVFSTAVSSMYGVYGRINKNDKILYIISIFAYCFSLFGFSNLITYLFGIMGVVGIAFLGILSYLPIKGKVSAKQTDEVE